MAEFNIQMKNTENGVDWDELFPVSKFGNIFNEDGLTLEEYLDTILSDESETHTVGSSGDFSTINEAIDKLSKKRNMKGADATLQLQSGFVIDEQVEVIDVDLGWITITSVDSTVLVGEGSLTTQYDTDGEPQTSISPIFAGFNATLPKIDVKFDLSDLGANQTATGLYLNNSKCVILPDKGFENATYIGIFLENGSNCVAHYATVNGAGNRSELTSGNYETDKYGDGFRVWGSILSANHATANNVGDMGFNISMASIANINSAEASNSGHHGLLVTTGSICSARDGVFVDSLDDNITVYASGALDARNASMSGAENGAGIVVTRSSIANIEDSTANNCGNGGIYANNASYVNAYGATVENCPDHNITAGNGSFINFIYGTSTGANGDNIHCTHGSIVTASYADLQNASRRGIMAYNGQVYAMESDCRGAGDSAIYATQGSRVSATGATLSDSTNTSENGVTAYYSDVIVKNAIINDVVNKGCVANEGARIIADATEVNNAGDRAFHAYYGEITCAEASATNAGHRAVEASRSAVVRCYGIDVSGAGDNGLCIYNGSAIYAGNFTGTANRTLNEVTSNGFIIG